MVEGSGIRLTDHEGRSYIDGLSGVFAVSLGHGNEEIIDAIVAQHRRLSFSSPIMTTTDRALELATELIRRHGRPLRRRQAALERVRGDRGGAEDGAPVPPPERQPGALQDDLLLPLLPRRHDGRPHLDGLAAAAGAVRAARQRWPARAPADPGRLPRVHRVVHARLPRPAPRRDRAGGAAHGLGGDRRAGDADGGRARALGRLPPRAAGALRRDGRAPDLRRDRDRVRAPRCLVRGGAGRGVARHPLHRQGPHERVRATLGRPPHREGGERVLGQRRRRRPVPGRAHVRRRTPSPPPAASP